ncbi:MAG: hypothetical protein V4717_23385 [Bacteroidota bacterium]
MKIYLFIIALLPAFYLQAQTNTAKKASDIAVEKTSVKPDDRKPAPGKPVLASDSAARSLPVTSTRLPLLRKAVLASDSPAKKVPRNN